MRRPAHWPEVLPSRATSSLAALAALLVICLVPASEAVGAIALVKHVAANGTNTLGTSISLTVPPSRVAAGHTVIVTVAMDPAAGAVTCTDEHGNVYTKDADVTNGSGTTGVRTVVFSGYIITLLDDGETITVTHPSLAAIAVSADELSGFIAPAVDRTLGATGNDTSPSSGNSTATQQADELLIGAIGVESKLNEGFTPGPGYTSLVSIASGNSFTHADNVGMNAEYQIVSATGTYAAGGTIGTVREWAATIATYQEGSGTTTTTSSTSTTTSSTSTSTTTTSTSTSTIASTSTTTTPSTTPTTTTTTASSSSSTSTTPPSSTTSTTSAASTTTSTSTSTSATASTSTTTSSSTTTSMASSTSSTASTVTTSSSTSTSLSPSTSSSSTTTPSSSTTSTTLPANACSAACDDGDHCTTDSCDAQSVCVHVDQSPTNPAGVLCNVANVRDIMDPSPICARRCVKRLVCRLAQIEHRIEVGSAASASRRCRRALRAATRTARV